MTVATAGAVPFVVAGKDAKLELRIRGSVKDGTAAQFEVFKKADDSSVAKLDGKVTKGRATTTWTAVGPDEKGTARSHRVYYVVTVEGQKTPSTELEVYHDTLEVTSKDAKGAALKDVKFHLTVKQGTKTKHEVKGSTGSTGTFSVTGLPPGDVSVEWRAPERLIEWTEEKAKKRVAKLKKAFKVELVYPKARETHKQWVNLPAKAGQPDQGSKLKVRVRVHPDDGPSKKGDEVFLKLEYPKDGLSARKEPARGVKGGKVEAWSKPGPGAKQVVAKDGGEVEFEVELGKAGGDQVELHVGGTEACEDACAKVVNWRKLYYQLTRPVSLEAHPLDEGDKWLAKAFVVYERFKEVAFTPADSSKDFKGTWIKGRELGDRDDFDPDQDLFIIGAHNLKWAEKQFDGSRGKRSLCVTMADLIVDATDESGHPLTAKAVATVKQAEEEVVLTTGGQVVFPRALKSGEHPFISGTWKTVGGKKKASGKLTKDMVVIAKAGVTATIKLPAVRPDDPGKLVGGDVKILCTIKLYVGQAGYAGLSYGQYQVIMRLKNVAIFNHVVVHELGHNMRQAVSPIRKKPPKGLDVAKHGNNYEEHGHTGPHCNYGLNEAGATHVRKYKPDGTVEHVELVGEATDQPDYGDVVKKVGSKFEGVDGTCLMYGAVNPKLTRSPAKDVWCEKCLPFLLAESLEDVST